MYTNALLISASEPKRSIVTADTPSPATSLAAQSRIIFFLAFGDSRVRVFLVVSDLIIALTLNSEKQPYQLLRGYASPSFGLSLVVSQRNAVFTGVKP